MTAQQYGETAVANVQAFVDIWLAPGRDLIERIHADCAYALWASELVEVLRQLDDAKGAADFTQALADLDGLRAEVERLTRERDEARLIARILNRRDTNLHLEYEIHLGMGLVPGWLTAEPPQRGQETTREAPDA